MENKNPTAPRSARLVLCGFLSLFNIYNFFCIPVKS